jgi:hypothetical protein
MGQRSLLFHSPTSECPSLCISSVPLKDYYLQNSTNCNNVEIQQDSTNNEGGEEERENMSILSSWTEIPTNELFSMKFIDVTQASVTVSVEHHKYTLKDDEEYLPFGKRTSVVPEVESQLDSVEDTYVKGLLNVLYNSVQSRVVNLPIPNE